MDKFIVFFSLGSFQSVMLLFMDSGSLLNFLSLAFISYNRVNRIVL